MNNQKNNLIKFRIDFEDKYSEITGKKRDFPKYTTQLINIANQNAQGTRPKVVGKMSELIKQCPIKTYEGWKNWYLKNHPNTIEKAAIKIMNMIIKMKNAIDKIDLDMVKEWVEDLVIDKTAEGLIIQEIILRFLAKEKKVTYKEATSQEESQNIDGYLGKQPVQIKSITYLSKKSSVREEISIPIIYYEKTTKYLYIYYPSELDKLI
ncbi:MAG: MjaI family restriction endonuclease [Promethearchaeota archaeon]